MKILVCGGAGYIGSHTVRELVESGHDVFVLDNLSLGHSDSVKNAVFFKGDIADSETVSNIIKNNSIDACMHFAAYSKVGESIEHPDLYYLNNVVNSIKLLNIIVQEKVKYFIFSSTAAVYGEPMKLPIKEDHPTIPTNPYGATKLAFEEVLKWYSLAFNLKYTSLRYFNAAGADLAGDIGEDHTPETHLIPLVLQSAYGKIPDICVFGNDYPTKDKTCIRDYIHVTDLSKAHVLALDYLAAGMPSDCFNLGNGNGYSVLEIVKTAEEITGRPIKVKFSGRRAGDPAVLIASGDKARKILKWKPELGDLRMIIGSAWNWHKYHPHGFS